MFANIVNMRIANDGRIRSVLHFGFSSNHSIFVCSVPRAVRFFFRSDEMISTNNETYIRVISDAILPAGKARRVFFSRSTSRCIHILISIDGTDMQRKHLILCK